MKPYPNRYTKRDHEENLNELPVPFDDMKSNGGRIPDGAKYGTWLRRNDPIAFRISYREAKLETY